MYKVKELIKTCEASPSQWEITLDDGRMVYVRYRWGSLELTISPKPTKDIMAAVGGESIFYHDEGGSYDGYIDFKTLVFLTLGVLDWTGFDVQAQEEKELVEYFGCQP